MVSSSLPCDVIFDEILPRLPPKSVGRFRCVCRSWYVETTKPRFIQTHLEQAVQRNHLGMLTTYPGRRKRLGADFRVPLDFCFDEYKLFGSCNGIVCFVKENQVCLFNPCTKEFKFINFPYLLMNPTDTDDLDYDLCGFGYDSDEDDYKLIMYKNYKIDRSPSGECYKLPMVMYLSKIAIHSVNTTSRFTLSGVANHEAENPELPGIYLNGTLHWLTKHRTIHRASAANHMVFSFDVKNKVCREFELPENCWSGLGMGVVEGGKLCFCWYEILAPFVSEHQIWVMEEYGDYDSWSELFSIEEPSMPPTPIIYKEGEILLQNRRGELLLYHPQRETLRETGISSYCLMGIRVISYTPTLTSLATVGRADSQ